VADISTIHCVEKPNDSWNQESRPSGRCLAIPVISTTKEIVMTLTAAHLSPIIALIAGILILIMPRLLNYVIAIYLIVIGLIGLNGIYHFIH
jgi:DUF3096 family protein